MLKNVSKVNVGITAIAVFLILFLSGNLGSGDFLNNYVAFGYGGGMGGVILPPITAVNEPLYLSLPEREGQLFYGGKDGAAIKVEVPPLSVREYTIFQVNEVGVSPSNRPCNETDNIVGNTIYDFQAEKKSGKEVIGFDRDLSITITLPVLPADVSNLGIYFLNNNNQWVFGKKAAFDTDHKVTFQVSNVGKFAIINAPGLPRVLETYLRCTEQQVLGEKQYTSGSLLRTCDLQVYRIQDNKVVQIGLVTAPQSHYNGEKIFDVDFQVLYQYMDADQRSLRERNYSDGELVRACDWRIFRIENQKARYINNWSELHEKYEGQVINNVDYWILKRYLNPRFEPVPTEAVLGSKKYADGTLIRTPDNKVYIIELQKPRYINSPYELSLYGGQEIFNVEFDVLDQYSNQSVGGDQKILGVKVYGDGTLLRTRDFKVYIVENGNIKHIASIPGPHDSYLGKKIIDVDYSVLTQYHQILVSDPLPKQVLGVKKYSDGTLIRTENKKTYIIENQKARYISTIEELRKYSGQEIFNVDIDTLNFYLNGAKSPEPLPRVLGVKRYGDGTYLKTPDWKIYVISGGKAKFVEMQATPQENYKGNSVINVSYEILAQYK